MSVEEKAEKWNNLVKKLASGIDGKGYMISHVTMKGWDEIFSSWEKLKAIKIIADNFQYKWITNNDIGDWYSTLQKTIS